jgi:hypothetical protein
MPHGFTVKPIDPTVDSGMTATVDGVKLQRQIYMTVKIKRATELQWRIWLGVRLMYVAAWIMNCNIDVQMGGKVDE